MSRKLLDMIPGVRKKVSPLSRKVLEIEDPSYLKPIWERVFKNNDPFGNPFQPHIEGLIVFYPCDGYYLDKKQYEALLALLNDLGEKEFFVSMTEATRCFSHRGVRDGSEPYDNYFMKLPSHEEYEKTPLAIENSIYSLSGRWGIMISQWMHAVVGGDREFLDLMQSAYPKWREEFETLKEHWRLEKKGTCRT